MKKAMTPALAFFPSIAASLARAQSGSGPEWISGKITSIYEDEDGALISLEIADGEPYKVSVTDETLKGLSAGDVVTVRIVRGWAELIEIADTTPPATPLSRIRKRQAPSGLWERWCLYRRATRAVSSV